MAEEERDIAITRIWRHESENVVAIYYTEDGLDKHVKDKERGPDPKLVLAFDALYPYIAAPYLISAEFQKKVRPREVRLWHPSGGEMQVKLYGQIVAEGFDGGRVPLRTPKHAATEKLIGAVAKLVTKAVAYVDGERGESLLTDNA